MTIEVFNETELLDALRNPDLSNDDLFRQIVLSSMEVFVLDEQAIAREFGVGRSTMNRWKNGKTAPHPALRRMLFRHLFEKLEAR